MKRIILILLSTVFIFTSCDKKDVKSGVCLNLSSLNTAFSLIVDESEFKGNLKIENTKMTFLLNYPENVSGISFEITGENVSVICDNIKINQSFDVNNIFLSFYNCINDLKNAQDFVKKNGFYEYSGNSYFAKLDEKGDIISLKSKNYVFSF